MITTCDKCNTTRPDYMPHCETCREKAEREAITALPLDMKKMNRYMDIGSEVCAGLNSKTLPGYALMAATFVLKAAHNVGEFQAVFNARVVCLALLEKLDLNDREKIYILAEIESAAKKNVTDNSRQHVTENVTENAAVSVKK